MSGCKKYLALMIFSGLIIIPFLYARKPKKIEFPKLTKVYTPFLDQNRSSHGSIKNRLISWYGAPRVSYIRGHLHSGIDLKGKFREAVYSIGNGVVYDIHLGFPHRTVVVLHYLENGGIIYSSYKHIENIPVKCGQVIDENTVVGYLFTEQEHKKSSFPTAHLHFEIRKTYDDYGHASWGTMKKEELDQIFYDPDKWFKGKLAK